MEQTVCSRARRILWCERGDHVVLWQFGDDEMLTSVAFQDQDPSPARAEKGTACDPAAIASPAYGASTAR